MYGAVLVMFRSEGVLKAPQCSCPRLVVLVRRALAVQEEVDRVGVVYESDVVPDVDAGAERGHVPGLVVPGRDDAAAD